MRVLKINGQLADIDSQTAIGITFQVFDVANPNTSRVNVSNNFTLPKTARNNAIFGFAGSVFNRSTALYARHKVEYWVENVKYITDATARITKIGERYELFVFDKPQELDTLRLAKWSDFVPLLYDWLVTNKALETEATRIDTLANFVDKYRVATDGVYLPLLLGNAAQVNSVGFGSIGAGFLDNKDQMCLLFNAAADGLGVITGAHWCIYVVTIFEAIRDIYGVDYFQVPTVGTSLFDDAFASAMYVHAPWLVNQGRDGYGHWFRNLQDEPQIDTTPFDSIDVLGSKTVGDFITAFFQHFGAVARQKIGGGYSVQRFDDMITTVLQDFSRNLVEGFEMQPAVENFAQKSYIKFKAINEGNGELTGAKTIVCKNEGVPASADLFSIDAYIPRLLQVETGVFVYRFEAQAFETFTFYIDSGNVRDMLVFHFELSAGPDSVTRSMRIAAQYDITAEYTALDQLAEYPEVWTIRKWLTTTELNSIDLMARQSVWQLGGSFFINKIEGFNPEGSQQPVTVELIKVDNEVIVPYRPELGNYWIDFYGNIFTDNENNPFVW